ncbi:protein kinase [Kitasatospora sp. NBC_00085]|uniref:serine/threonine-protein kinase n=1 Tax=unclassified Kitasatospora TaxID=2633591 RepID=UPI003249E14A
MTGVNGALIGGRYQLQELIGQGGMGRVWRGWDTTLGRDVAVKEVLLPQGVTEAEREQLVQRVLREARAAARLNHPGIITVHDVAEHEGAPVIVMEFVTGISLAAAIARDGALPVARVAEIGAAMVKALQQAHAAGIVHRDLKPDNVLLMGDRVILTDFGIAHMADATTALTRTGAVIGTPVYMAPEQLEGKPAAAANDLWSLGATLYAAVEGETPFSGDTFGALCVAVVTKEPRLPVRAGGLTPVLGALLAKDPARRPTAEQALTALEALARAGAAVPTLTAPDAAGGGWYGPVQPATAPQASPGMAQAAPGGAWLPQQAGLAAFAGQATPPIPSAPPVASAPVAGGQPAAGVAGAMLVRFVGCMGLIWAIGTALPWNYLGTIPDAFVPHALLVTAVLSLLHALPRPRWHPAAVWAGAVAADVALFFLTKAVVAQWLGSSQLGFGEESVAMAVNMLLLGTGAWLLWLLVPGSRQPARR